MSERAHEGRASGKVILFGEHAVVYGVPGIAAGIDRGARAEVAVKVEPGPDELALGGRSVRAGDDDDLARAFSALLAQGPRPAAALDVRAFAEVPPGGGLGCSAALGVAIARAVEAQLGGEADEGRVFARGLAWEGVYHGNPSGIDTAAAQQGTFLWYERGKPASPLETTFDVWLAVGYSGSSASTKVMVDGIARIQSRNPELHKKFLDGVTAIVRSARLAIQDGDGRALGQLFDMNQMLLAGVMLSTEAIERMCAIARETGALGAKLTGSGGGGSVIALGGMCPRGEAGSEAERAAARVAEAWTAAGFRAFPTRIAATRAAGSRTPSPDNDRSSA